jgi:nucleoside-diphosphate-sugar epimerase
MKQVLVTGATGFIGNYVRKCLHQNGYKIISLVRNKKHNLQSYFNEVIIEGNLNQPDPLKITLSEYYIDACIHLAWEGIPDYSFEISQKNITYGINVLRLCNELKIKHLIISGSCWEYKTPSGCVGENWSIDDSNHFKAAKNALRMLSHAFCSENNISFHWLRLFYVYGYGQREGSLIPYIKKQLLEGNIPKLNGWNNRNDFIHVTDVANAFIKTLELCPEEEIINIGFGKSVPVIDILDMLLQLKSNNQSVIDVDKREVQMAVDFWADNKTARKSLDWKPKIDIFDWLKETE